MALPPLAWIAEEDLVYDEASNRLHRPSRPEATGIDLGRGESFASVWAPRVAGAAVRM